jgi:hypothetical protein
MRPTIPHVVVECPDYKTELIEMKLTFSWNKYILNSNGVDEGNGVEYVEEWKVVQDEYFQLESLGGRMLAGMLRDFVCMIDWCCIAGIKSSLRSLHSVPQICNSQSVF